MGVTQALNLIQPTDFQILDVLEERGRNVAPNIAAHLDKDKNYINTRLPQLNDYRLIRKIGPSERSGLYEITDKGKLVLEHRAEYEKGDREFDEMIERLLAKEQAD